MLQKIKSGSGRKTARKKARFETLENRRLLTVTVKVANNDIFISGDGANNGIAVFQDAIRRLFIYGDVATSIAGDGTVAGAIADTNPGGGREFDPGQFTNIFITMGSGNDLVQVAGLQSTDVGILSINTGDASGGDNVSIGQSTFAGSPDIFFGFNAVTKGVSITGGNGNDVISINALTAPSLTVSGGALPDVINIATSDNVVINGNASVSLDDGGGTVNVGQNSHTLVVDGNMSVTGGSGNDFFTLDGLTVGNVSGNLSINTGLGNDQVTVGSNSAVKVTNGDLTADLGDSTTGNIFTIGANATVNVSGDVTVRNGAGNTLANSINIDNLTAVNLSLTGGNADDRISLAGVHGDALSGSVSINSGNGGVTGDQVFVGSSGFAANIAGNLSITAGNVTGNASNLVGIDNSSAGSVSITTGNGTQQVFIGSQGAVSVTNDMAIKTGTGADTISVVRLTAGLLSIDSGAGADTVDIGKTGAVIAANGLSLSLGDGDDQATVNQTTAAYLSVEAGDGKNTIKIGDQRVASSIISGAVTVHAGAGDDTVNVDRLIASSLSINTDGGADTIKVAQNGAVSIHGDLNLNAGDGTNSVTMGTSTVPLTIDGNLSIVTGSGSDGVTLNNLTAGNVLGDLNIQTGAGDDTINVGSTAAVAVSHGSLDIETGDSTTLDTVNIGTGAAVTISGNTAIVTGNGNDVVNVQSLSTSGLAANTGAGNDQVTLNRVTSSGYIAANLGEGTNTLTISNSSGTTAVVTGGSAIDTINLNADTFANLTMDAGNGNNIIHLSNSTISQTASVNTGTGKDQVFLSGIHAGTFSINTGAGNDTVSISAAVIDHLLVDLGAGNDTLTAANSTFTGSSILEGGSGKDHIKLTKVKFSKNFWQSFSF